MATVRCPYCDSDYEARRGPIAGQLYSCRAAACVRARKAEYARKWQAAYHAEHGVWQARRYTEDKAKKAERDRRRNAEKPMRQRYPAQFAAKDARRRMRIAEALVEPFDPADVFERDGWVCQLCQERVDPELAYPDPLSKSLDHIVPISKGGAHSFANGQLAHLRCNIVKRDRVGVVV